MRSNSLARRQDQLVFAHRPSDFEVGQLNISSQRSGDGEAAWTAFAGKTTNGSSGTSCSDHGAANNDNTSSHRKIKRRVSDFARYSNSFSMTRMTKDH